MKSKLHHVLTSSDYLEFWESHLNDVDSYFNERIDTQVRIYNEFNERNKNIGLLTRFLDYIFGIDNKFTETELIQRLKDIDDWKQNTLAKINGHLARAMISKEIIISDKQMKMLIGGEFMQLINSIDR